jgi:hypothetical protein
MLQLTFTQYKIRKSLSTNLSEKFSFALQKNTNEVGQLYSIITFGHGIIMKAMTIMSDNSHENKQHIILILIALDVAACDVICFIF